MFFVCKILKKNSVFCVTCFIHALLLNIHLSSTRKQYFATLYLVQNVGYTKCSNFDEFSTAFATLLTREATETILLD
jgi:ribosomal protein S26